MIVRSVRRASRMASAAAWRLPLTSVRSLASIATSVPVPIVRRTVSPAANTLGDGGGYFSWPTETFIRGGYAIAMKTVDISKAGK